jgi:L-alanine-DL-glutamate epimerase-like enolase superfamily enzyme
MPVGSNNCYPKYSWIRLDDDSQGGGFNYRFATVWGVKSSEEVRTLTKAWGVRVVLVLSGQCGRAAVAPLLISIGAGIGLLAVSAVICDLILQYILPQRRRYTLEKFQPVTDSDYIPPTDPADVLHINLMQNQIRSDSIVSESSQYPL